VIVGGGCGPLLTVEARRGEPGGVVRGDPADSRIEGLSVRALARKYGIHRRTVREALSSAWPRPRKKSPPRKSRLDPFKSAIDGMLRADLDAPRKQRHTGRRIFDRLVAEYEMEGISYATVCDYVRWRRSEIRVEAGRDPAEVFIAQTHRPGVEAEVDFGEVWVKLAGTATCCHLFTFRLSFSGKAVHRVFASCGQEAFFEGHVHAFRSLGGVPTGKVRYDNLRSAVRQVLGFSRSRVENERWVAFRSHYGLDAFYCQPGLAGAHEKGGVEGEIGRFRRNHLVPVPEVASLAELNMLIDEWDLHDEARRIGSRPHTVGEHFAIEQPLLNPLPAEPFETARLFTPRVDRFSQITVRMNRYSVPVRLIGRQVRVLLHASELVVLTAAARWPATSGWSPSAASAWNSTTTWKRWCASPAPYQARPRWSRPAPPASSPRSTTPGGRQCARLAATPRAPAH
jgi:transposase